ncbi:major histocompatibility complex class I-related gene protein isoform X2 [Poecilia latipinna]|uniref:major histocompatibility complex class I-related gene protein isoform X2 n=1 Tax=Poecilia latipinna TaxID=48699 RepID=UPI00072E97FE|nr:PREDICTED: major histocompatibility complex class I-related gene protein-like isoform X2 [Poecilia latipinna]
MTTLIFLLLSGIPAALTVTHSLKYFYTASSGVPSFPSYVSVGFVNDVQISYCDSNINKNIPKQDWMNNVSSEHPNYWEEETLTCREKQKIFKKNINIAKQRFNHTGGVHVFQQMYGCEWDDETGEVRGYDQIGYDGEDLIILDPWTHQWIAPKPQADITIQKWDHDRNALELEKSYLTQTCAEWLQKYVNYGRSSMMRTDLPSVSFLQKSPSSVVSCLATGFYPNRAEMFWRKDGKEIHDGVDKGEILPNNDGTFQMSVYINLSSVPPEDWPKYECVFQLSGVNADVIHRPEKRRILTNKSNTGYVEIAVGALVALGVISVIFIGWVVFFLRKKCKDAQDAKSPTSSLYSDKSGNSQGSATSHEPMLTSKKKTTKRRL